MDNLKVYLAQAQKHHFWILCGVVLLVSLASWYKANSALEQERSTNQSTVVGTLGSMDRVIGVVGHPNEKFQSGLKDEIDKLTDDVFVGWGVRHNEQLKVPQWDRQNLGDDFVDFVERRPDDDIPAFLRELYQNYVKGEIQPLFKIVNVREPEMMPGVAAQLGGEGGLRAQPGGDAGITWRGLVAWDAADRLALQQLYDWKTRPTSLQIRYANEDLWVYRALLQAIAATNTTLDGNGKPVPISEHLRANIKKIEALNIGQFVTPNQVQLFVPLAAPTTDGEGGGLPGQEGGLDGGGGRGLEGEGGGVPDAPGDEGQGEGQGAPALRGDAATDAGIKHFRYVDDAGKPLAHDAADPYAEFKIMPFQINLLMDQRKLPDLLVHFANSPLPVEVRQVSITSLVPAPVPQAGAGGGEGGGGRGLGGGQPGLGHGAPGRGAPGAGFRVPRPGMEGGLEGGRGIGGQPAGGGFGENNAIGGEVELRPYDLRTEIRGVVYIFNRPEKDKVGKGNAASGDGGFPADPNAGF